MIKILGVETHYRTPDGVERLSAVDWWRVINPLKAVSQKHKDIKVDFIKKIVKTDDVPSFAYEEIGQNYDVIWTSYMDTPKAYSWIKAVCDKYHMVHVMDLDDNIFEVDNMNPAFLKYAPNSEGLRNATIIISDAQHMVVSTKHLQNVVSRYRQNKPIIFENYISDEIYKYDESKIEKHDGIYIGYQGSATHYTDFMKTGILYALRRLLKENPKLKFYIIGMAFDEMKRFLPEDRIILGEGQRDHRKWRKTWQEMPVDIGIAPLVNTSFNKAKSSIKYYEYALRKIPAVYSWVDPYLNVVKENETGYLAQTELEWYEKIKYLLDEDNRKRIAENAYNDVLKNYTIKSHIEPIYNFIQEVYGSRK